MYPVYVNTVGLDPRGKFFIWCSMANLKNMTRDRNQNGCKYLLSFLYRRWVAAVSDLQPDPDPFHLQRPVQLKRVPLGLSG